MNLYTYIYLNSYVCILSLSIFLEMYLFARIWSPFNQDIIGQIDAAVEATPEVMY